MKRLIAVFALVVALALGGGFYVFGDLARANAGTFHVNYDRGRDDANGLTPATAWKHSPGDPQAQGGPARTRLQGGDKVLFAAGVRYRGTIRVTSSGAAGNPIVFAGAGAGATIDGSDPARMTPCPSAADCGGAARWQNLVRIQSEAPVAKIFAIFTSAGQLRPAQGPDPKDDFYREEIEDMAEVDGRKMSTGQVKLPHAIASGLAGGGGTLALWVKPNRIAERPILGVEGDIARFDPRGLQYYEDRTARVAVLDHASLVDKPGEYVSLTGGQAVAALLPSNEKTVSVASGRGGFHLRAASHIVIRDLGFENMADGEKLAPAGVAIFTDQGQDVLIENNRFANFVMPKGQGPIISRRTSNLKIVRNQIDTVTLGSGVRLGGPASNIVVAENTIRHIGRTGIMLIGIDHATIERNMITDIRGVHGNGLSAYLGNHDVSFIANTVFEAKQPATFHGAGKEATRDTNLLFANNLFVALPDALGALISWGSDTRGVIIRNNVLLGGKAGLRLSDEDHGVVIADNVASGMLYGKGVPADWRLLNNTWTALSFQQKKEKPSPPVSGAMKNAVAELAAGRVPPAICAVVERQSLGPSASAPAGAVGAALRC